MRLALTFLLLATLRLTAAVGDLIGLEVETNGWVLRVTIAGLNTNGIFSNGLRTNNTPGTEKLRLTVQTPGFSTLGVSNYVGNISIATTNLRFPYPMQNTNDYVGQGDDVVIRVALSRKINTNEVVTGTALVGYYAVTNGTGTNANAFTSQTVTNNSTNVWSKVIAGWAEPGFQVITSSTYQISVVAFQEHARNGSPVAAVRFWNEDSAGNKTTQLVSQATRDSDGVIVFKATMDASTMTQSAVVTNNFIAYPWVGTSPHVSADYNSRGTNALLNALIGSNFYLCDKNGTYGRSAAAVDAVNGVAGGVVITNLHFSGSSPPTPFATIGQACNAIAASNNIWYSRNDSGYGEIYCTNGFHTWAGTASSGTKPVTYTTVRGWPGSDRSLVIISNQAVEGNLNEFIKITSLTVTSATTFTIVDNFWADDVVFNPVNLTGQILNIVTNPWLTGCKIQGMNGANSGSGLWHMRNCEFSLSSSITYTPDLLIGCWQTSSTPNAVSFQMRTASLRPRPVTIYAFNRLYCQTNNSASEFAFEFPITQFATDYIGCAFVQNIVEDLRENSGAISVCSSSTSSNLANFICWNNTTVGQKCNWFYTGVATRKDVWFSSSIVNNLWEEQNLKTDDYSSPNAANVGNWEMYHGVGNEGNMFLETINVGAPASFDLRFPGINSWLQSNGIGTTNTYLRYTDRQAYAVTNDFGNGNYKLLTDSPAFRNFKTRWVLPFDIDGKARSAIDPPGAYVAGNAKKGAMF